jgi:protein subunit release factor A
MKLFIELHEEQGGQESKLLVGLMADIYQRSANQLNITCQVDK